MILEGVGELAGLTWFSKYFTHKDCFFFSFPKLSLLINQSDLRDKFTVYLKFRFTYNQS